MKELRHTEERNARKTESLKVSQEQDVFVDEFGCQNPHVSVGPIAADGKPDWREFILICLHCKRMIKKMGTYTNPPINFCCGGRMRIK